MEGTRPAQITADVRPLVVGNAERVVGIDIRRQPVGRTRRFLLEGPKQPVPDDEHARVVFVEVRQIGSVVDAVV